MTPRAADDLRVALGDNAYTSHGYYTATEQTIDWLNDTHQTSIRRVHRAAQLAARQGKPARNPYKRNDYRRAWDDGYRAGLVTDGGLGMEGQRQEPKEER